MRSRTLTLFGNPLRRPADSAAPAWPCAASNLSSLLARLPSGGLARLPSARLPARQPSGREVLLVVGSVKTGRTQVLCETGTSFGRPQYSHAHPYFSPDCRWVIFTSDRTGIAQLYAASVPEGLLEELDQ